MGDKINHQDANTPKLCKTFFLFSLCPLRLGGSNIYLNSYGSGQGHPV